MTAQTPETRENRIKRLIIRANRRGIKEMDLVIGGYANLHLKSMADEQIDAFEELMAEQDQDLLSWITGQEPAPARFRDLLTILAQDMQNRL